MIGEDGFNYGELAISFALNAITSFMEAVNSLEKDPYIKAGTAPFMVGTYTAGFLQNLRSEMDENDGFNMRSFAEATVKTFVPLHLARLIGSAILTTTSPWFAVLGTGIAVGMLTDNLVNQNFFDDGTSSAADKLFEWEINFL